LHIFTVSPGVKKEIEELDIKQAESDVLPEGIISLLMFTNTDVTVAKQMNL